MSQSKNRSEKIPAEDKFTGGSFDVAVVGAGMAGLIAATLLAEAGRSIALIEATDHVGGRMLSRPVEGLAGPIELGAEFVHGRPDDLLNLLEQAGLKVVEVEGDDACFEKGRLTDCGEGHASAVLEGMVRFCAANPRIDMNFAAYTALAETDKDAGAAAIRFVEGFNAADASLISIQALAAQQRAEDAIDGEKAFRVREGYSALAAFVHRRFQAAGGTTLLNMQLAGLDWAAPSVLLKTRTAQGERSFSTRRAVIALPLGTLQSGSVRFSPELPIAACFDALAMGPVLRVVLVLRDRFWAEPPYSQPDMSFLFARTLIPGVFWTRSPATDPVLTAWVGGTGSAGISSEAAIDRAIRALCLVFDWTEERLRNHLVSSHCHDWNVDPFAMGAYSYVREGGLRAAARLGEPVEDKLFFAGEHTDQSGHWGTVHGALRSGVRAAQQILALPA